MIIVIDGLAGSGKSWLMSRLLYQLWRKGIPAFVNYPVCFSEENENVQRWQSLAEIYNLEHGNIGIDEGQKLFDARNWQSLPQGFIDKISQQRKDGLNIITTTQDFLFIDFKVRANVHERYTCVSMFRFPRNENVPPILQMVRVRKAVRKPSVMERQIIWRNAGFRFYFISRYWTRKLYDTYAKIGFEKFICKIYLDGRKWKMKLYSREIVNNRRKRL